MAGEFIDCELQDLQSGPAPSTLFNWTEQSTQNLFELAQSLHSLPTPCVQEGGGDPVQGESGGVSRSSRSHQ